MFKPQSIKEGCTSYFWYQKISEESVFSFRLKTLVEYSYSFLNARHFRKHAALTSSLSSNEEEENTFFARIALVLSLLLSSSVLELLPFRVE